MKLNLSKEWFDKHLAEEEDFEIGAGHPSMCSFLATSPTDDGVEELEEALGVLVKLKRREMGMSVDELAKTARVETMDIKNIECHASQDINPRTIHKLAEVFKLPTRSLMMLSGVVDTHDDELKTEALRFAARSEKISSLSREERKHLAEFVKFLSSRAAD